MKEKLATLSSTNKPARDRTLDKKEVGFFRGFRICFIKKFLSYFNLFFPLNMKKFERQDLTIFSLLIQIWVHFLLISASEARPGAPLWW